MRGEEFLKLTGNELTMNRVGIVLIMQVVLVMQCVKRSKLIPFNIFNEHHIPWCIASAVLVPIGFWLCHMAERSERLKPVHCQNSSFDV